MSQAVIANNVSIKCQPFQITSPSLSVGAGSFSDIYTTTSNEYLELAWSFGNLTSSSVTMIVRNAANNEIGLIVTGPSAAATTIGNSNKYVVPPNCKISIKNSLGVSATVSYAVTGVKFINSP